MTALSNKARVRIAVQLGAWATSLENAACHGICRRVACLNAKGDAAESRKLARRLTSEPPPRPRKNLRARRRA